VSKNNNNDKPCPCGTGKPLSVCCEPVIMGQLIATSAETLMRSRYTAYVIRNEQYLLDSWHKSTRPDSIDVDKATQWIRLKILNSDFDRVEFIATYRIQGKAHKLHENSRFVCEDRKWFYVDGVITPED